MTWCTPGRSSKKKSCRIYEKSNFKPQILSIFYFDQVSDGRMDHVLGAKLIRKIVEILGFVTQFRSK